MRRKQGTVPRRKQHAKTPRETLRKNARRTGFPEGVRDFPFRLVELRPTLERLSVSLVIPCRNEGEWLQRTLASLAATLGGVPHEVIVVDDGSTDGSCDNLPAPPPLSVRVLRGKNLGVARARNLGAAHACGDVLLFHDAHVVHRPGWLEALLEPLRDETVHAAIVAKPRGVAEVPLLPGGCAAVKREAFQRVRGFDPGFSGWGYEDQEFSLHLWRTGHRIVVQPSACVVHVHRAKRYTVDPRILRGNLLRMVLVHFDPPRIGKVLWCWRNDWDLAQEVAERLVSPEHLRRREEVSARAVYSADWFFRRFGIPF